MRRERDSWQCPLEWQRGRLKVGLTRPSLAVVFEHMRVIGSMFTLIERSGVVR